MFKSGGVVDGARFQESKKLPTRFFQDHQMRTTAISSSQFPNVSKSQRKCRESEYPADRSCVCIVLYQRRHNMLAAVRVSVRGSTAHQWSFIWNQKKATLNDRHGTPHATIAHVFEISVSSLPSTSTCLARLFRQKWRRMPKFLRRDDKEDMQITFCVSIIKET